MSSTPAREEIRALAEQLRPALLRASRRLRHEARKAGVSALDAQILGQVRKEPGIGVSGLAVSEQMTRPSMSGHLKRLAAAGWIVRDQGSAADRRRVGVRLTAKGEKALDAIRGRRNDWLSARLSMLPCEARAALAAAVEPLIVIAGER
ncbi:MAG: MarR family winged helix-turn-helix transcriptional regulator [Caulobacteraceae bacterium]